LVQSLRLSGMDKSTVSRICKQRDAVVDAVRNRPLESDYPYVWLDALYLKVRVHGRVVSQALVMAIGVRRSGERDVLGLELGCAENRDFWLDFLRGLKGVQLVISDAHEGLKDALQQVFAGCISCRMCWPIATRRESSRQCLPPHDFHPTQPG